MNRTGEPSVEALLARIAALQVENRQLTERVVRLEEELALARLHRFAPRSEKHVDRLFNEAEQAADEDDAGSETDNIAELPDTGLPPVESTTGKKRGRRPLPANLPRERVEYDLPDDQKACPCCRGQMHRMGETVTEQLHIEVKAKVLQNVRFKYGCRHCDRTGINAPVVTAPMPTQPLPGSVATASTLAFALVHKYVDGTPLYRLAQAFERAGVPVSRGALGHWVIGSSEKHLHRISDALKLRLRLQPLIHGDETTVQVLKEKDKKATSTSYMWAYRSGQGSHEPIVLLDYQPGRGQIHPQAFLGDYRGIVMSDGYTAWRTLEGATHIGCMAHSRRRFVDALKARKKGGGPPEQALRFFEQLYRVERQARDEKPDRGETPDQCIRRFRQQHSIPVLNALKEWLDQIAPKVLPDSKLGDAVSYTLNQWSYLTRYTQDGRMPIDNNLLERDIRIFATGRKSWLFSDTVEGARASAVVYSLMLTCRASRVEPLAWLRHVLTELPQRADDADITDLLPFNFPKTAAA
ncbi:transposase [Bradyrhizobium sp. GM5.1]|jgi:transposase|uniref:IS66 family transposase n=2 Tax=unclassified Bradyrhizobium TaxID=2631580 RepID=UPI001FF96831|nr:IS66 family transposase [Bradyrhizobium sp. 156]MCK1321041.1 IS66 family transposase [Bradyrhizobium sp. 156]MCK1321241.1 IS66 family transposase [Bradyrhizobium sp. 156]MCK1322737.1 IS66 family transposase [Bradyrhizobium sp. 156]MCK1323890.1 IS66 family transposase [Bradyrhizobium sp. 156]MCK1325233.1 IS66 family transposase [Bradyrhizobium sp. 156]